MLALILLDIVLVSLLKVLRQDNVPILPDSLHSGLLTDGVDVRSGDAIGSGHVILQVDLLAQIHLSGDGGEDEALLAAVGQGEFDLAVKAAGAEEGGVKGVLAVGGHDHLKVKDE